MEGEGGGGAHNISNINMGRDVPTKRVLFLVCLERGCVSLKKSGKEFK